MSRISSTATLPTTPKHRVRPLVPKHPHEAPSQVSSLVPLQIDVAARRPASQTTDNIGGSIAGAKANANEGKFANVPGIFQEVRGGQIHGGAVAGLICSLVFIVGAFYIRQRQQPAVVACFAIDTKAEAGQGDTDHSSVPEATTVAIPSEGNVQEEGDALLKGNGMGQQASLRLAPATVLVAGTMVGAGILALPEATYSSGFGPSTFALLVAYGYMLTNALLTLEVSKRGMDENNTISWSYNSMAKDTLGPAAVISTSANYLIQTCLLVAYNERGGEILSETFFGQQQTWYAPVIFTSVLAGILYKYDGTKVFDRINAGVIVVLTTAFFGLIYSAAPEVNESYLSYSDWSNIPATAPILILSLVFHNIIPYLLMRFNGDVKKTKTALIAGSAIPLAAFAAWNAVCLGLFDPTIVVSGGGIVDPVEILAAGGTNMISASVLIFSFAAITSSYWGFLLGLGDLIKDLGGSTTLLTNDDKYFGRMKGDPLFILALSAIPPLLWVELTDPAFFYKVLEIGGGIGVATLYGVLPPYMAYVSRHRENKKSSPRIIPGGDVVLALQVSGGLFVMWEAYKSLS